MGELAGQELEGGYHGCVVVGSLYVHSHYLFSKEGSVVDSPEGQILES